MGSGERRQPCETCGGDGRVRKSKRISLTIPGGVEDGTRLRVSREGNAGRRGGPPGDLYVCVTVKDHAELRREGMTIYSDVSVRTHPPKGLLFDACFSSMLSHGWESLGLQHEGRRGGFEFVWLWMVFDSLECCFCGGFCRVPALLVVLVIRQAVQVPYVDAALGTTVNVTTVDGPVDLKIPEGTQPGTTLLLSKRGAPSPMKRTDERGDHLIKIKVRRRLVRHLLFSPA